MKLLYCLLILVAILIVDVHNVPLDSSCSSSSDCDGGSRAICQGGRCQCNQPWARACNSTCEWNINTFYEGEMCFVRENCLRNMNCLDHRCRCLPQFDQIDGVCLKPLNTSCQMDSECFSNFCLSNICQCPTGYDVDQDGKRCRIRLVKIYNNWLEANGTNQTCINSLSCMDVLAECVTEGRFLTQRYCRCRSGYRVIDANQRCEPDENAQLSPLNFRTDFYASCGFCRDDNAACMKAANQSTCWCRAPYRKVDDRCEPNREIVPRLIFPNELDRSIHSFTNNCTSSINDTRIPNYGLCTYGGRCLYDAATQKCEPIAVHWIDEIYEYGLCTRINSLNQAVPDNNLCPAPLFCEERQDKYVCTCGRDRFLDIDNQTRCVNYIGRPSLSGALVCPLRNTQINNTANVCECIRGYQAVNNNRQCDLILSAQLGTLSCDIGPAPHSDCTRFYGNGAFYCCPGECRCIGGQITANENRTSCVGVLNEPISTSNSRCPANARLVGNICTCNRGFLSDPSGRFCELYPAILNQYSQDVVSPQFGFNTDDCLVLFTGPVQYFSDGVCQCRANAFINDDGTGCWYQLNAIVPIIQYRDPCVPEANIIDRPQCTCDPGFKEENGRCVRAADRLYELNDTQAVGDDALSGSACNVLFGAAATYYALGRYCTCQNEAYPVSDFTFCLFYVGRAVNFAAGNETCPPNTVLTFQGTSRACNCLPGYYPTFDGRFCQPTNLSLVGVRDYTSSMVQCCSFAKSDCEGKFGSNAFFFNGSCYCDRRTSYLNGSNQCESFSTYVFPGLHHLSNFSCERDEDCGNLESVKCDFLTRSSEYKVCQCRDGWLLNVKEQICVRERCVPACDVERNFECRGYECVCRENYHFNGTQCVLNSTKQEFGIVCNITATIPFGLNATSSSNTVCNRSCRRFECAPGYRRHGSACVRKYLEDDRCFGRDFPCGEINSNAVCNNVTYRCSCAPGRYRWNDECGLAVNERCSHDEQCAAAGRCQGGRCRCASGKRAERTTDIFGRTMERCVNAAERRQMFLFVGFLYFSLLIANL